MKVAMAQINSNLGDLEGNVEKIISYIKDAREKGADIVAFPEMAITGYPPLDLLHEKNFVRKNKDLLEKIVDASEGISVIVGFVDYDKENLYNSAAVISNKKLLGVQHKTLLPTYDVFDEDRYFTPAQEQSIFEINGTKVGVEVCEDLWDRDYEINVTDRLVEKGADVVINISSSPFYVGKVFERLELLKEHCKVPICYVNVVGGQDELVFDGQSLAVKDKKLVAIGKQFEEDLVVVDLKKTVETKFEYNREKEMYDALVLGVRDYFRKIGFKKAILGVSGGIDSALVAAIGADALGKENVVGVSMPSRYSSGHSKDDAKLLAENLGIGYKVVPIETGFKAMEETLSGEFSGTKRDVAEENLQARLRGMILMALSNKFGYLVLSTGNKTEMALGYCTLYGDMAGGISPISDLSKPDVYKLSSYVNEKAGREIIPKSTIEKIPSAELKEGQFDPFDYAVVSPLVDEIVENHRQREELIGMGYKAELVDDMLKKIKIAEYKRRQAAPGIKITRKAFGLGRKMPIANQYSEVGK